MSAYYPEPASVGEMLARYRDVKRRLYPPIGPTGGQTMTATEAEAILAFAIALPAFMTSRADESERRAAAAAATGNRRPTASAAQRARAAIAAVSSRTGVPVEEIFGRKRIPAIASARHEAIWRVRRVTNWSLPRVGRYFAERDHTTILHSIRRMEDRAARDPTIRAYMTSIERQCSQEERTSEPATGSPR
jgi:chromosomal replication initiation ATPase DnaA